MLDVIWNVTILGLLGWAVVGMTRAAVRKIKR